MLHRAETIAELRAWAGGSPDPGRSGEIHGSGCDHVSSVWFTFRCFLHGMVRIWQGRDQALLRVSFESFSC